MVTPTLMLAAIINCGLANRAIIVGKLPFITVKILGPILPTILLISASVRVIVVSTFKFFLQVFNYSYNKVL